MTRKGPSPEFLAQLMKELLPKNHPEHPNWRLYAAEHNRQVQKVLAQERWEQRQRELPAELRQRAIDSVWEATTAARHGGLGR